MTEAVGAPDVRYGTAQARWILVATVLGSGIASWFGQNLGIRRSDLRTLVGCGAAAAIAAAFNAPLAGAFYAFELVIGTYSISSLAPVGIAALVGYLTARTFAPLTLGIEANAVADVAVHDVVIAAGVGLLASMVGITVMRGVAACERAFARLAVAPEWRPMIGGSIVGLLAIVASLGKLDKPIETVTCSRVAASEPN